MRVFAITAADTAFVDCFKWLTGSKYLYLAAVPTHGWLLSVADPEAAAQAFAAHAVAAGWGLIELDPDYDDLEQRFLALTSGAHPSSTSAA